MKTSRPWFVKMSQQAFRIDLSRANVVNSSRTSKGSKTPKSEVKQTSRFVVGKSVIKDREKIG